MALTSFDHDGLTFRVVDEGPADGDPVVLLHGFPAGPESWAGVATRLHEAGLRTIAPEQRGYGPAATPRGRRAYGLHRLVGDAAALIERVGAPVHLVGHDWGATVAWATAARHPDLVRTLVAGSVGHPAAFLDSMLRSAQLARSWYMVFFQLPVLPERALASARGRDALRKGGLDEAGLTRFQQAFPTPASLTGPINWYRGLPFTSPRSARLPVRVPTTMVWSDRDVALTRASAEGSATYVEAPYSFEALAGVSHWLPEEAPERFAELVLERIGSAG